MLDINNYYEQLVTAQLLHMAKEINELNYKDFMEDVACIALNELPARYVRSLVDLHSHFTDLDKEAMEQQVADAIQKALVKARRRSEEVRD